MKWPCPCCARTVPRISADIVRASNVTNLEFSKLKGTTVNLNILEHFLDDEENIDGWQIEIRKKNDDLYEVDELLLYVSLLRDVDKESFREHLNQEVLSASEVSFNKIIFVSKEEIQHRTEIESAVKAKKIIDRRPKP